MGPFKYNCCLTKKFTSCSPKRTRPKTVHRSTSRTITPREDGQIEQQQRRMGGGDRRATLPNGGRFFLRTVSEKKNLYFAQSIQSQMSPVIRFRSRSTTRGSLLPRTQYGNASSQTGVIDFV